MKMKCAVRTNKGALCERNHKSGCTHQGIDGWVYFLCKQHFDMLNDGKELDMVQLPSRGHKADQPQLDLGPIAQAYVTKEKEEIMIVLTCRNVNCKVEMVVPVDSPAIARTKERGGFCKACYKNGYRECDRCAGDGKHMIGVEPWTKEPIYGGKCFRCAGKGYQSPDDVRRNYGYDNYGPAAQSAVAEARGPKEQTEKSAEPVVESKERLVSVKCRHARDCGFDRKAPINSEDVKFLREHKGFCPNCVAMMKFVFALWAGLATVQS